MPSFTIPLYEVVELTDGRLETVNGQTRMIGGDIGLNHYPIFDPTYREVLNGKIIDRYMNREIGAETIAEFRLFMRRTANEVMPLFNQLYLSEKISIDPLSTVDLSTISDAESSQVAENKVDSLNDSTVLGKSRSVTSTFPQNQLAANKDYADGAADVSSQTDSGATGTQTENSDTTGTQTTTSSTKGYQGSPAELLMRFRDSFLNIDVAVIESFEDCFMGIYRTSDTEPRHERMYY